MTNIILSGCGGRMGQAIIRATQDSDTVRIVAGVDINAAAIAPACTFPVYNAIDEFPDKADVIIDFSHHTALNTLAAYAAKTETPIVLCTTGHTDEERAEMEELSKKVAIFFSGNMSIGINLLIELAKITALAMPEAEIEIIESHHNRKLDSPSGTALMLANAICEVKPSSYAKLGRSGQGKRTPEEIGIHSVRMGNVVGIHEVIVGTKNQTITLKHEAHDRALFAEGGLCAAAFLKDRAAGLYDMSSLIDEQSHGL
jgi:4-hydroxy-tetrahydrodipicolinate reductase